MSPRVHTALAALAVFACLSGGAAVAEDPAKPALDADDAPLAALALALAAAPVPQLQAPEPGGDAASREPRVELAVTFAAGSVVFEELPRIRMTFGRPGPLRAVWRVERRNLPARVEPGVEYRDVEVRLTLSSTLDEFESLIEDATRVADGLRVESPEAPRTEYVQPQPRARVSSRTRTRMDAINADRARAGLLPRKPPPAPGSTPPVPAAPPAPAHSQVERTPPAPPGGGVPAAAPESAIATAEGPATESVVPLVDVVLEAMRSRFPAGGADARGSVKADTSLESLGVRVRDPLVESRVVGRAGELVVSVQTGSAESSQKTGAVPAPAVPAAPPDVGPAPAVAPVPAVTPPQPAASRRPAQPVLAVAPPRPAPSRDEPSRHDDPGLLSRWRTAHGEVMERTLDSSGVIVERQVDPPDGWQKVIHVSKLAVVSQRRDAEGRVVQVVQDVSGAHIEVTRDPIGRYVDARVLRR